MSRIARRRRIRRRRRRRRRRTTTTFVTGKSILYGHYSSIAHVELCDVMLIRINGENVHLMPKRIYTKPFFRIALIFVLIKSVVSNISEFSRIRWSLLLNDIPDGKYFILLTVKFI